MTSFNQIGKFVTIIIAFISVCMAVDDDQPIDQVIAQPIDRDFDDDIIFDKPIDQPIDQPIASFVDLIEESSRADTCNLDVTRTGRKCRCNHECDFHKGSKSLWCYTDENSNRHHQYCCRTKCVNTVLFGYKCSAGLQLVGCDPNNNTLRPWPQF